MSKLYEGNAKIVKVFTKELFDYQTKGLTPEEAAGSFNIVFKVQPDDASFGEIEMDVIEFSTRECTGKLAGNIQAEITIQQLKKQGLLSSRVDIKTIRTEEGQHEFASMFVSSVGKTVAIYQKESVKGDKTYVNTYFSNGAAKLSAAEMQKRLAMLTGKRPAAATAPAANDDPFAN